MYSVTKAALDKQLSIFSEARLLAILPDAPMLSELDSYLVARARDYLLIAYKEYEMLFEYYPYPAIEGVFEIHLACPKASIVASRVLCLLAAKYIFEQEVSAIGLITTCPEGKIANLCRKLGASKIADKDDMVILFITKQQLGL